MIVIGERINGTSTRVREAVTSRNTEFIAQEARRQAQAGADYIDVNAGTPPDREPQDIVWLVEVVQTATEKPVSVDSPNPEALKAGLEACQGKALVNSVSAEEERLGPILTLAKAHDAGVVGLALGDAGLPKTADERLEVAKQVVAAADSLGISRDDLFIDPLVRSVAIENEQGAAFLDAVSAIRESLSGVHIVCGLSNVSFQMPSRKLLNRTFLAMAMARGLDAAILDPLDAALMSVVCAGSVLLGNDDMCMEYIQAHRSGRLM